MTRPTTPLAEQPGRPMGGEWLPITEAGIPEDGYFVVGWWFRHCEMGTSWEISDDLYVDCATHFCRLPKPPVQS